LWNNWLKEITKKSTLKKLKSVLKIHLLQITFIEVMMMMMMNNYPKGYPPNNPLPTLMPHQHNANFQPGPKVGIIVRLDDDDD